ncbi:MAG: hypothetical protein WCC30_17000 [Candidatus Dormiibacterota bacterium]
MSLRSEIHAAIDDIAPSMGGLPERAVDTVLAEGPARRGRNRMLFRMRAPLSLVAAIVAIALVAALLVGGRLVQDWNSFHNGTPAGNAPSVLSQLEARRLNLPAVEPGAACPDGPITTGDYYGAGPAYAELGLIAKDTTSWGTYGGGVISIDGSVSDLVLVRARDLHTGQLVEFVGQYGSGPVEGKDVVEGKKVDRHPEAAVDMNHPPSQVLTVGKATWNMTFGLAKGYSGCVGWQVDSPSFSEVFVIGLVAT